MFIKFLYWLFNLFHTADFDYGDLEENVKIDVPISINTNLS